MPPRKKPTASGADRKRGGASQAELAAALKRSLGSIRIYLAQGMPYDSIASAQAWMAAQRVGHGLPSTAAADAPGTSGPPLGAIADLEERIGRARRLAESAQRRAQRELDEGDGDSAKKSGDLASSAQKTLLLMEREMQQRRIEARELVPMESAKAATGKVIADLIAALKDGEVILVEEANPDNPGRAQKAFRKWRDNALRRISEIREGAK